MPVFCTVLHSPLLGLLQSFGPHTNLLVETARLRLFVLLSSVSCRHYAEIALPATAELGAVSGRLDLRGGSSRSPLCHRKVTGQAEGRGVIWKYRPQVRRNRLLHPSVLADNVPDVWQWASNIGRYIHSRPQFPADSPNRSSCAVVISPFSTARNDRNLTPGARQTWRDLLAESWISARQGTKGSKHC